MTLPELRRAVRTSRPLIHCITNPISINQCANAILAVGARPIMAEHPGEVQEITAAADALLLNLGSITAARMEAMRLSVQTAKAVHLPIILDAVGVSCSALRRDLAAELLETAPPAVIKGNYSEIFALYHTTYHSSGVDADAGLSIVETIQAAAALAQKHHTVILASGKSDIVTDGTQLVRIQNGTPQLASITGTGCMLGALTAAYAACAPGTEAAAAACVLLGVCGEMVETAQGSGSFQLRLLDALSTIPDSTLEKIRKMEAIRIEA